MLPLKIPLHVLLRNRHSTPTVLMFVLLCSACSSPSAIAQLKGDAELLKMTATAHNANRDRILSWQGYVTKTETYGNSTDLMIQRKDSFVFLYDVKMDAVRWKKNAEQILVSRQGELGPSDMPLEPIDGMLKENAFYKYWPSRTTNTGERKNSMVIFPRTMATKTSYSESFHPMWYLSGHMTRCLDDLSERLMFFYGAPDNPGLTNGSITQSGDIVSLILDDSRIELETRYVFDLSKGGNIVRFHSRANSETELREWTYERKLGIWIPKTFSYEFRWNKPDHLGHTYRTMKVTFIENVVNKIIPPSEFTVEKLGIQVGDPVTDRINGVSFRYGGGYGRSMRVKLK